MTDFDTMLAEVNKNMEKFNKILAAHPNLPCNVCPFYHTFNIFFEIIKSWSKKCVRKNQQKGKEP